MSSAATALIWWIIPIMGLIGGLGYVLWISKFQGKYRSETQRSVGQFKRFQDSFRAAQARDNEKDVIPGSVTPGSVTPRSVMPGAVTPGALTPDPESSK